MHKINITYLLLITILCKPIFCIPLIENSIVATDIDFITASDPSLYKKIIYQGKKISEMPQNSYGALKQIAHCFSALYTKDNQITVDIFVDKNFSMSEAKYFSLESATRLGKLPYFMLKNIKRVVINKGNGSNSSDIGLIILSSQKIKKRIHDKDLEETLFHEAVHATLDPIYLKSEGWASAQKRDNEYISEYARSYPFREDLAETALFAYTLLNTPKRIPSELRDKIKSQFPNKIKFIQNVFVKNQVSKN